MYADRLRVTEANHTTITRAFTGRAGRGVSNAYVRASTGAGVPPAPYPVQRGFTRAMREDANKTDDTERMQMWSGQAARIAQARPAGEIVQEPWADASQLLA